MEGANLQERPDYNSYSEYAVTYSVSIMLRLALLLIATLQVTTASGQVAVRGVVKDPTGANVVGATASVESRANGGDKATNAKQVWELHTGVDGMFSLPLPHGQYGLCVAASGFQTNCTDFSVGSEPPIVLRVTLHVNPNMGLAPSSVMDNRLRELAGTPATDCGRVEVGDNPAEATACVLREFQRGQPFIVRYDVEGVDSEVSIGLVSDSRAVYTVSFDSFGTSLDGLPKGSKLADGNHNVILPCPVPVKLRVTSTGKATCLGGGKKGSAFLGPNF